MATISSMVGDGFYDRNSHVQQQFIFSSSDQLMQAVERLPLPQHGAIGLADLGCSEGKNSVQLMRHVVDLLRKRRPEQTIVVTHNDLPANNFNELFHTLNEWPRPYGANAWAMACAGSFFQPVVPPGTLHLACCYSAVHWLSRLPEVGDPTGVLFSRMTPESRNLLAAQAALDWESFLRARARELVSGGQLVIVTGGRDGANVAGLKMYALLEQILGELQQPPFVMPIYYRSQEEILEPLRSCGFRCDHFRIQHLKTPFAQQLEQDGDRLTYARATTAFVRAWMEPLLPEPRIYERMEERMAAHPEGTSVANVQVVAAFTRL
ncbi:MAG: hypothetical protein U0931_06300 [Vulcanimicrobiota bacterium]